MNSELFSLKKYGPEYVMIFDYEIPYSKKSQLKKGDIIIYIGSSKESQAVMLKNSHLRTSYAPNDHYMVVVTGNHAGKKFPMYNYPAIENVKLGPVTPYKFKKLIDHLSFFWKHYSVAEQYFEKGRRLKTYPGNNKLEVPSDYCCRFYQRGTMSYNDPKTETQKVADFIVESCRILFSAILTPRHVFPIDYHGMNGDLCDSLVRFD